MRTEEEIKTRLNEINETDVCSPSPEADGLYWIGIVLDWVLGSSGWDWGGFKDECEAGPKALAGLKKRT